MFFRVDMNLQLHVGEVFYAMVELCFAGIRIGTAWAGGSPILSRNYCKVLEVYSHCRLNQAAVEEDINILSWWVCGHSTRR